MMMHGRRLLSQAALVPRAPCARWLHASVACQMAKKKKKDRSIEKGSDAAGKSKALEMAIKQIEASCGKNALMKLGDKPQEKIAYISTGSINLDGALGIGG